jgi:poly-gamma-glutamate synthesis protein (capsule biosynthesis protein)
MRVLPFPGSLSAYREDLLLSLKWFALENKGAVLVPGAVWRLPMFRRARDCDSQQRAMRHLGPHAIRPRSVRHPALEVPAGSICFMRRLIEIFTNAYSILLSSFRHRVCGLGGQAVELGGGARKASMRWVVFGAAVATALLSGAVPAAAYALTFRDGCRPGPRVRIAAVGDLLFHEALQRRALAPGSDFRRFWQPVQPILDRADIVYGNLEGPAAHGVAAGGSAIKDPGRMLDGRVYGKSPGFLVFNYHPSVITDLKASGFTVVSTANNHAADRGALGIDRTIDNLRAAGLAFTGTRRRGQEAAPWSTTTRARGLAVAWLACTYSTNGIPDRAGQVLDCYRQRDVVMGELARLAADAAVDAVILTPHWGQEYSPQPLASDRAYAREAIEAGADAVLGAHPHVLQPWEKLRAGNGREGLVIYSLGNFVSNQQRPEQRSGIIALIELTRPEGEQRARVTAAGFVPTWVEFTPAGHRVTEIVGEPRSRTDPLAATLRLLPKGNRVSSTRLDLLPRDCGADLVASAAAAPLPPVLPPSPAGAREPLPAVAPAAGDALPEIAGEAERLAAEQEQALASDRADLVRGEAVRARASGLLRSPLRDQGPRPSAPEPRRSALRTSGATDQERAAA